MIWPQLNWLYKRLIPLSTFMVKFLWCEPLKNNTLCYLMNSPPFAWGKIFLIQRNSTSGLFQKAKPFYYKSIFLSFIKTHLYLLGSCRIKGLKGRIKMSKIVAILLRILHPPTCFALLNLWLRKRKKMLLKSTLSSNKRFSSSK